jgi:selenide,water dikinase
LRPLQSLFDTHDHPDLLVGLGDPDDAAVWKLDDSRALVVTTDFFTPVVDEAYDFGAIAAANALSDLYAMGATPFLALNLMAVPPDLPAEVLADILRGGADKVKEAGAVVAGGHSIKDPEPKYGLVALGFADPSRLMTKGGARQGDVLYLTKPLGTGVTTTALKQQAAAPQDVLDVTRWMSRLNLTAARQALVAGVRGATDITGYGLIGHAVEMAAASGVGVRLHLGSIPFLAGAPAYARAGYFPGGSTDNRDYFGPQAQFEAGVGEVERGLLFDAQTSGGLLLSIPEAAVRAFETEAAATSLLAWPIGRVESGEGVRIAESPIAGHARPALSSDERVVHLRD